MVRVIVSKKGGDGKTPIAIATAKATNSIILMNDEDITEAVHENTKVLPIKEMAKLNFDELPDTVIDIGGHIEAGILEVVRKSDIVIIPIVNDSSSLHRNGNALAEFYAVNKNIIILVTRTKKATDFENVKAFLKNRGLKYKEIFELKESELFANARDRGLSIDETIKAVPSFNYLYGKRKGQKRKSILEQWNLYITYIKNQTREI